VDDEARLAIVRQAFAQRLSFRIERAGGQYLAQWLSAVAIFPCEGARDPKSEAAVAAALEKGGWKRVTRLYRSEDIPEDRCWLRAPGWSLAYS
jgi:protein-L-isoaspartate(D-aspartate) O-methyltransferase